MLLRAHVPTLQGISQGEIVRRHVTQNVASHARGREGFACTWQRRLRMHVAEKASHARGREDIPQADRRCPEDLSQRRSPVAADFIDAQIQARECRMILLCRYSSMLSGCVQVRKRECGLFSMFMQHIWPCPA
jgi:hypothetical protein